MPIVGDCKAVIADLIDAVDTDIDAGHHGDYAEWLDRVAGWKEMFPLGYTEPEQSSLAQLTHTFSQVVQLRGLEDLMRATEWFGL